MLLFNWLFQVGYRTIVSNKNGIKYNLTHNQHAEYKIFLLIRTYCAKLTDIIGYVDIIDTIGHSDSVQSGMLGLHLRKI